MRSKNSKTNSKISHESLYRFHIKIMKWLKVCDTGWILITLYIDLKTTKQKLSTISSFDIIMHYKSEITKFSR